MAIYVNGYEVLKKKSITILPPTKVMMWEFEPGTTETGDTKKLENLDYREVLWLTFPEMKV